MALIRNQRNGTAGAAGSRRLAALGNRTQLRLYPCSYARAGAAASSTSGTWGPARGAGIHLGASTGDARRRRSGIQERRGREAIFRAAQPEPVGQRAPRRSLKGGPRRLVADIPGTGLHAQEHARPAAPAAQARPRLHRAGWRAAPQRPSASDRRARLPSGAYASMMPRQEPEGMGSFPKSLPYTPEQILDNDFYPGPIDER